MSPLQVTPASLPVPAGALTTTHLGRTTTSPPTSYTEITGTLVAVRHYQATTGGRRLTTLEIRDATGRVSQRTVDSTVTVTLRTTA